MIFTRRRLGTLVLPATLAALAGCGMPLGGNAARGTADSRALAACRRQADDAYLRQNRDAIYRADQYAGGGRDSPFANVAPSNPTAGLSSRYGRETMVDDCLNAATNQPGATPTPPPPDDASAAKP